MEIRDAVRRTGSWLLLAPAVLLLGCGGGETAIVGIGNSGNRQGPRDLAKEIADAFDDAGGVPEIDDAVIRELYDRVIEQARAGDPQAILIVLELAKEQREDDEEG